MTAIMVMACVGVLVAVAAALVAARAAGTSVNRQQLSEVEQRLQARLDNLGRDGQATFATQLADLTARLTDGVGRVREETSSAISTGLTALQREMVDRAEALRLSNEKKLSEIRGEVEARLDQTVARNVESFNNVAERLEKLREATGQVVSLSAGIEQLNRSLATPKGRGAFGELSLSEMLADLLPAEYYDEQFELEPGHVVDAAVHLKHGELPIDAKFTVMPSGEAEESKAAKKEFAKAVEARASEIATRYIRPPRTLEFAFMYVPAESIYYRVISNTDLHKRLLEMRVIPVSPNTLYASLQALALGFRGMKIEDKAREIERLLAGLQHDFGAFTEDFRVLGKHLSNARDRYEHASRDVTRFHDRLQALQLGEGSTPARPRLVPSPSPTPSNHSGSASSAPNLCSQRGT